MILKSFLLPFTPFQNLSDLRMKKIYMASVLMLSVFSVITALQAQVGSKATGANPYAPDNMVEYAFDQLNANTQTVLLNQLTKQN